MPAIVPLVEGDGDVQAVPILIRMILEDRQHWTWRVATPKPVRSLKVLEENLERFLRRSIEVDDCGGILITLDLDDGCAMETAQQLAGRVRALQLAYPVIIALAGVSRVSTTPG